MTIFFKYCTAKYLVRRCKFGSIHPIAKRRALASEQVSASLSQGGKRKGNLLKSQLGFETTGLFRFVVL